MRFQRRLGGLPLAIYVVALLLIPLLGVSVFSVREINRNNEAASAADSISRAATVHAAASSLLIPLEIERIATVGLARIDELGLERKVVLDLTGVDFELTLSTNEALLATAFGDLERVLDDTGSLGRRSEVIALQTLLASQRAELIEGRLTAAESESAFESAFDLSEELLSRSEAALGAAESGSLDAATLVRRLRLVVQVVRTARQEAASFTSMSLDPEPDMTQMMEDGVRHIDALDEAGEVDPIAVAALVSDYAALSQFSASVYDVNANDGDGGDVRFSPSEIEKVAQATLAHVEYLYAVGEFAADRSVVVNASVDDWAEETGRRNRDTLIALIAIGLATFTFGLIVIRSFAKPLQRLRVQAEQIGRGELAVEPVDLHGPSDIRKVTGALNDMASTLSLVDDHMQALAIAENGEGPELTELPGHVGASMRTSMERVTALTTRLQMSEARLAEEARIDNLTGLPNRFAVVEYLERELRRVAELGMFGVGQPGTGVMFVDIDGFKSVNDTHGHAVGDVVLREIAQRLNGSVRDIDFVARLGGDEFLIVVGDVSDPSNLMHFGERMIEEIEQPYVFGEQLFGVSASVGVTMIEPGDHSMSAVERADAAVYQAKRHGRRRVEMFDKELQRSIEHQAELELALRQAIQHDELRIYLQPLADMANGHCVGAEALVRWERPGVGLVPPGDFIPIAERSGLIFDLERWVLEGACRRIAEWGLAGRGAGMRLAVNISGRHLIEGDLLADLDAAIAATGADPNLLEIELTESQLLDDVGRASDVLAAVRGRGVKVAIDDFGTGYSSMTYLQKLPVDVVKIDRSFIATATANEFDSTIVESVVTIGRALSLDIVAEGIETFDQLAYAMSAGVTLGQGFLFARPMPAVDAEAVIFGPPLFDADRVRREADLDPLPWTALPPAGMPVELAR